ncbi:MAG: ribosome maturation factor RimM [Pacificimonas sp.]
MADDTPVILAAIAGAQGVTGEVRLKLFAASEDSFRAFGEYDAVGRTLVLKGLKRAGKSLVARFEGVDDRNAAEALRGTELTVPRDALPPPEDDESYVADLIGLPVATSDGALIGHVRAIENYGAGDIVEIEKPAGGTFMLPYAKTRDADDGHGLIADPGHIDPADLPA